ncbi:MAG: hypothetical protein LIO56_02775, partial [Lachnospiraceae bacterium]|nr:hypothetical protein [Lachnospiraceae bacterium]
IKMRYQKFMILLDKGSSNRLNIIFYIIGHIEDEKDEAFLRVVEKTHMNLKEYMGNQIFKNAYKDLENEVQRNNLKFMEYDHT